MPNKTPTITVTNYRFIEPEPQPDLQDKTLEELFSELEDKFRHIGMLAIGAMPAYSRREDVWDEWIAEGHWPKWQEENTYLYWRLQDIIKEIKFRS